MTYSVTGIKTFTGMEGPSGLNAKLRCDGKIVADLLDEGCGGALHFRWIDRADLPAFEAFVTEWYAGDKAAQADDQGIAGRDYTPDTFGKMETWVNRKVDEHLTNKRLLRAAKKSTLFRLAGDGDGVWRQWSRVYSPEVEATLRAKYPNIETVFNPASVA